jgi:50S ribosomal protein L16 3-hydroxylase
MVSRVHSALAQARPTLADTERFLLEYLSEPKAQVVFRPKRPALSRAAFDRAARRRGLALDRRSRLLAGRAGVGCNGEYFAAGRAWMPLLRQLANDRELTPAALRDAAPELLGLLHDWQRAAWLGIGP